MKKISRIIALAALALSPALHGHAQTDAAAKSLLDKVSRTYEAYKSIQTDFSLVVKQAQQPAHTESGAMVMETSTGKYHITTDNEDIISDGQTQWMVLKDVEEIQVTEVDPTTEAISPTNIFSFYNKGYKYVSADDERVGNRQLAVVELTPEDTNAPYFKIKLRVDEGTYRIHDVTIFDKGGNQFVYTIGNTKINPQVADSRFVLQQADYPDFEMVDLR